MDFKSSNWYSFMDEPMRDLVEQSLMLLDAEVQNEKIHQYHDYGFIVFPMAKAYEGFLKKFFYSLNLITSRQYMGDNFRIGKALSPNLPKRYQWDWVYGKLREYCHSDTLPLLLWQTWRRGRNQIFHYFPNHQQFVSLQQAQETVWAIGEAMDQALVGCKLPVR